MDFDSHDIPECRILRHAVYHLLLNHGRESEGEACDLLFTVQRLVIATRTSALIIGVDLDLEAGDGPNHIGAMKLFHAIWYLSVYYPDTDGNDIQDALEILGKSVKKLQEG